MEPSRDSLLFRWLRDAPWLTPPRARAYAWIFTVLMAAGAIGWLLFSHGRLDPLGKLLGTDYASFWSASRLALKGQPASAYDPAVHSAIESTLYEGRTPAYSAFFYPPVFLLYVLPAALLPYLYSLVAWLALTGTAYLLVMRRLLSAAVGILPALAFPAILSNLGHGQNAFLATALTGAAILFLGTRPLAAGGFIGALAFKPHLAIAWPFALIARGRHKTFAAAAFTVVALAGLSYAAFGKETWAAFLHASKLARAALEQDLVGAEKMASVFAGVRLIGGSVALAYAAQALAATAALGALVWVLRKAPSGDGADGAATVCAGLLATPFLLDYDLMLLAIPMAWLTREGVRTGFRPWEKTALALAFVAPLLTRSFALLVSVPIAPFVIAWLYALILGRALRACSDRSWER